MRKLLISIGVLIAYITILIKVMVFKDIPTIRIGQLMLNFAGTDAGHAPNFVPFKTIVPYLFGYKGLIIAGVNLIGNVVLLVPVGFLMPFVYRQITWQKSLAIAIASGLSIEVMQTVLRVGIFDIDDVILNALGVMIGYCAFVVFAKWMRERKYILVFVAICISIAVAVGALYAIYPHGQPVVEPGSRAGNEQEVPQSGDLCGGTGGNGQIVSVGSNAFTIDRQDGSAQMVSLTSQATIETSAGPASVSDLEMGDRVTLVGGPNPDGSFTAEAVFVCGA